MPSAPARPMGTWKLAYADFLTALAAFFLVMWLVKGMPQSGREDIADYFAAAAPAGTLATDTEVPDPLIHLSAAIAASPAFADAGDTLDLVILPDGIRIDLMEQSDATLFARGDTAITAHGQTVAEALFTALSALPYAITMEGHTDAFPYAGGQHSNWSLSTGRAETMRRLAIAAGIDPARIRAIIGYGDRKPRLPRQPHHPTNRRVTVILHVPPHSSIPVT